MKKIFILVTMTILSFLLVGQTVIYADTSVTEYTEEVSLIDADFIINGESVSSDSDYQLNSDTYTTVEFLIPNILDRVSTPSGYVIDEISLEVVFDMIRVSDNINVSTYDVRLINVTNEYSTINGLFEVDRFYLYLDDESELEANYDTTFYYTSDGSSSTLPGINYSNMNVHFVLADETFDDVIDVGTNYELLPDTDTNFIDILTIEEYDHSTYSHELTFAFGPTLYKFDVAIPEEIYNYEYEIEHEENSLSFEYFNANQMSITTSPDGEVILYIQPDDEEENHPYILEDGSSPDIVGFSSINLSTMEYKIINKLELYGVVNQEDNRYASLYCFFPTFIEDLLSISLTYEYRINTIFAKGDWQTALNTYVRGDSYNGQSPSWLWWIPAVGWGWIAGSAITGNAIYDVDDVIIPINESDIPDDVINKYETKLGGDSTNLDNLQLYKISLGQYQDGIFTAFSDENAYDIEEIVILEILYEFEGEVYIATADQINTNVYTPELSTGSAEFFDNIAEWLGISVNLLITVVSIIGGVIIISKFNLTKKPGLMLIVAGTVIYILYKTGIISW